jgi:2-polyprenyl-3-methyl-5-hydroxy-6-metoxy-1,4-benzoquinol methylase
MSGPPDPTGFRYRDAEHGCAHRYLLPFVSSVLERHGRGGMRIMDLGCGNGSVANAISRPGREIVGIDSSEEGIAFARASYPQVSFHLGSVYDDVTASHGLFDVALCLEVIEHVYFPRRLAANLFKVLKPGGLAIVSTPYHGYWKNLALALTGRMDGHFTALWDHGHIKFWSVSTLTQLLTESGFKINEITRLGRIPTLAKSMVFVAEKPKGI